MRNRSESVQEITIKFYRHMFVFELYVLYLWKLPAPPRAALCYIVNVQFFLLDEPHILTLLRSLPFKLVKKKNMEFTPKNPFLL